VSDVGGVAGAPADDPSEGVEEIVAGLWRVPVASRPLGPWEHTNAYVLGGRGVSLVVDPGADEPAALEALAAAVAATGSDAPKGIMLTHTHPDHIAGLAPLRARWPDVPVYVHPLEADAVPRPTPFAGGRRLVVADHVVEALATPGHSRGHLALWLAEERVLLAGDLVAGRGTIWVGAPDGDVTAYLDSLARAAALEPALVAPGHGPVRRDGATVLREAREHRLAREAAIVRALAGGALELPRLRDALYGDLPEELAALAERSLLAHLEKLMREHRVMHAGSDARGPYLLSPGAAREG
jgi:endoribonuclease LACTB2